MRKLVLSVAAVAAMAAASAANATSFIGSTTGCFGVSCVPTSPATLAGTGLTFTSGTFNQQDSGGFLAIGSGNPPTDTLGLLTLIGPVGSTVPISSPFTLLVSFTSPAISSGTFFAAVHGSVGPGANAGGAFFDFDNTPVLFGVPGNQWTLTVNDVGVSNNGLATPITGQINAVPEAKTWAMMLLGFAGIGFAMRRRRTPVLAQVA